MILYDIFRSHFCVHLSDCQINSNTASQIALAVGRAPDWIKFRGPRFKSCSLFLPSHYIWCHATPWNWQVITPVRAWRWNSTTKDGEGIWWLDWFVSNRLRWKKKDKLKGLWCNTSALVCGLTHFHLEMRVWLPMILSFDLFRLEISSISQGNL